MKGNVTITSTVTKGIYTCDCTQWEDEIQEKHFPYTVFLIPKNEGERHIVFEWDNKEDLPPDYKIVAAELTIAFLDAQVQHEAKIKETFTSEKEES